MGFALLKSNSTLTWVCSCYVLEAGSIRPLRYIRALYPAAIADRADPPLPGPHGERMMLAEGRTRIVAAGAVVVGRTRGSREAWRILILVGLVGSSEQFPGVPKPQPLTLGYWLRWQSSEGGGRVGQIRQPTVTELRI
jgi:hypothetical protein